MLPLIAAAGVAVALSATALAWLLDRGTDAEIQAQSILRQQNEKLRQQYRSTANAHDRESSQQRKVLAETLAAKLRANCEDNRKRLTSPKLEFASLACSLEDSLADGSISPFRRNALRLLQARLEDAQNRIDAFDRYCDWYLKQLDRKLERGHHDAVIDVDGPQSRLPEDWLYHGKIGLVSIEELDKVPNDYYQMIEPRGQRIGRTHGGEKPQYSDAAQRTWMMQYSDPCAIPVQLFASNHPNHFSACILRGAMYVEHMLEKVSCSAIVVNHGQHKALGEGYAVRCFPAFCKADRNTDLDGGIRAFLPRSESSFPGKRYSPGERIDVYIHYHDLLLRHDVTVTQHAESLTLGATSASPIFIHADAQAYDLHPLRQELARGAPWQLRDFTDDEKRTSVVFQVGSWMVETEPRDEDSQLCVTALTATGIDTVQLDTLPFAIRLIDIRWKDSVFCDVLKFNELIQFCHAQTQFSIDDATRKATGAFFERWSRVTDYLLEEEGYRYFALTPQAEPQEREWDCIWDLDPLEEWTALADKASRMPTIHLEERYLTSTGEARWLTIARAEGIPEKLSPSVFRLFHSGVQRPDPALGFRPTEPVALRIRVPNSGELANLERQKRALQAMMNGRLTNPALQQILIMPGRYIPQPSPYWQERIAKGLSWHNQHWRDPIKGESAKRVVEAALMESNLYLMQGPPGTGKTTCIVEILQQIFAANPATRVLVVSQQNTAVDNALERFLDQRHDWADNILRIGNDPQKVHPKLRDKVTGAVMNTYLEGRRQEYSLGRAGMEARAAWIKEWMDQIAWVDETDNQLRFDDELTEMLIGEVPLVGATCVGLASRRYGMDRLEFDVCIIDEGGRAAVPELLIPLMRCRKAIIIGDHYQLPPNIASRLRESDAKQALPFLEETFLKKTFFEHLYENLPTPCRGRLSEQFRMAAPIGDLVSDLFYREHGERTLFNGDKPVSGEPLDPVHVLGWHDVNGRQEREHGDGSSLFNKEEAAAIIHYLSIAQRELTSRQQRGPDAFIRKSVAIITPYSAQKRLITGLIQKAPLLREWMDIDVDTVDSFQGSEADIVLYSTVRTRGNISFLLDRQRLNVACSRARENLVFFGNAAFLTKRERENGNSLFSAIIESCRTSLQSVKVPRGKVYSAIYVTPE